MAMRHLAALAVLLGGVHGAAAFELTSPMIAPGSTLALAQVHADCGGSNVAPALAWSGTPAGTKSFAVTLYDPDASGGWWHWIVYDIPASASGLAAGGALPAGTHVGKNDFGARGYGGACPPQGSGAHHYQFTVWALGTPALTVEGAEEGAIIGPYLSAHALAHATLTATYER